jgi:cytochrome P450
MAEPPISLPELLTDPDAALRRARRFGAVAQTDIGPLVVSHEALRGMLQDERMRPSFTGFLEEFGITSGPFYDWMKISPLDMDGDEHRKWRQIMARAFTPKSVERLRPFLRTEAAALAARFASRGTCDFVEEFARKLPSLGLSELIGVPAKDRDRFTVWADTIGLGFNFVLLSSRIGDVDVAIVELLAYAKELVEARRREPEDDLVTRIAEAVREEGGISEDQIRGSVAGLVFAGHETTKNQLGWMIAVLADAPEEWDRVAKDPSRARDVIEEVLRLRSAASSLGRLATADTEVAGTKVPAGSRVAGSLWGANRDPKAFPSPDRFDAEGNRVAPQLAFGHGAHHCLGAALARAELQESLIALSQAITCPRVLDGATYLPPLGITGPSSLPIAFTAR